MLDKMWPRQPRLSMTTTSSSWHWPSDCSSASVWPRDLLHVHWKNAFWFLPILVDPALCVPHYFLGLHSMCWVAPWAKYHNVVKDYMTMMTILVGLSTGTQTCLLSALMPVIVYDIVWRIFRGIVRGIVCTCRRVWRDHYLQETQMIAYRTGLGQYPSISPTEGWYWTLKWLFVGTELYNELMTKNLTPIKWLLN